MSAFANPLGTDGFEFVEFTSPEPAALARLFAQFGFVRVGRHRGKRVDHYRQGDVNLILNAEPRSQAEHFAGQHGPSANAFAIRVHDARHAFEEAVRRGAQPLDKRPGPMELAIPAIAGVDGLEIYLVDRYGAQSIYDVDFEPTGAVAPAEPRFLSIDHLTHNLHRGQMDRWASFYEQVFGFREIRHFDIEGERTGLVSRAMVSPCGKVRIPLNESRDDESQVEEFLRRYRGEGIQHIALATGDIVATVEWLRERGVAFQVTPDSYYEAVDRRVAGHRLDLETMRRLGILVDGAPERGEGLLLQIFTTDVIGPIFFEIIERQGNNGFGEGNFQALFESIERDQVRRGVLSAPSGKAP